ncbi:MAG: hypothetical protein HY051_04235 [Candidatus Aenigmarchaeota archaeon]|nr:hypothetical protein [Candidatus Aenigmarchaeota archaeon]
MTGLTDVLGDNPTNKVLDFFIINQYWDYSLSQISDETGVNFKTLQELVPKLIKKGLLLKTRRVGKADLYGFDRDNIAAVQLDKYLFNMNLVKHGDKKAVVLANK